MKEEARNEELETNEVIEKANVSPIPITAIVFLFGMTGLLGASSSFRTFFFTEAFSEEHRLTTLMIIVFMMMTMFLEGAIRYNKK